MRLLVVLVAFAAWSPAIQPGQPKVAPKAAPKVSAKVTKKLGEQTVGLLAGATKVEVFRVDSKKPGADDKTIGGYRISSTGNEQDAKFAARLAGVVLNEKSYLWDAAKGCIFDPGLAFRVWKGEESVAIVICFGCDQAEITALDKDGKASKPAHGETDPGRAALLKLAKDALPFDDEIQKLQERP